LLQTVAVLSAYPLPKPVRLLLRRRVQLLSSKASKLTLPSPVFTFNRLKLPLSIQNKLPMNCTLQLHWSDTLTKGNSILSDLGRRDETNYPSPI
jgi:hypothetical protein